jgi:DNA segregation ATPase FtsK/SpoIIIE-like protein
MTKKKADSLEISSIRVKYDKNDGILRITSKDPDLRGKPFSLTVTTTSPSAETLMELMRAEGLIPDDPIPTKLQISTKAELQKLYDPTKPLTFDLGQSFAASPVTVDLATCPNLLVCGGTGSGKSLLLLSIIAQANLRANIHTTVFNPKVVEWHRSDLKPMDTLLNSVGALQAELTRLIVEMYSRYKTMEDQGVNTLSNLESPPPFELLVVDDASMFLDPETGGKNPSYRARHDYAKGQLFELLRLGRGAGIHVIFGFQSLDATLIPAEPLANIGGRIVMGSVNFPGAIRALGQKSLFGAPLLQHRGRGLVQIYSEQKPFQMRYVPRDLF